MICHLAVAPGQPLADDRVVGDAALLGQQEQAVELGLEADRLRGRRRAALVAEQAHRHRPAVVDAADDLVLGAHGVGVEDLVELALAGDHLDRPDLDAGLAHVDEEERDALVLRGVGVGAGEREDVVGEVAGRRPDLLPVEHPLVAVERGLEGRGRRGRSRRSARSSPGTRCPRRTGCAAGSAASAPRCPRRAACCRASGCRSRRWCRRSGTPARANSSARMTCSSADRPAPPYSVGQPGREVPGLVERRPPRGDEVVDLVVRQLADAAPVRRQLLGEERLHLVAIGLRLGTVCGVHQRSIVPTGPTARTRHPSTGSGPDPRPVLGSPQMLGCADGYAAAAAGCQRASAAAPTRGASLPSAVDRRRGRDARRRRGRARGGCAGRARGGRRRAAPGRTPAAPSR